MGKEKASGRYATPDDADMRTQGLGHSPASINADYKINNEQNGDLLLDSISDNQSEKKVASATDVRINTSPITTSKNVPKPLNNNNEQNGDLLLDNQWEKKKVSGRYATPDGAVMEGLYPPHCAASINTNSNNINDTIKNLLKDGIDNQIDNKRLATAISAYKVPPIITSETVQRQPNISNEQNGNLF